MRKTTIWLWGPDVDPRFPPVIAEMLRAGPVLTRVPTGADVDLGNPLAPQSMLVVHADLTADDIERLHTDSIISPEDTHFVRMASFQRTASAGLMNSVHGRQAQPLEQYAQSRGYKTRLLVTNDTPDQQIANLLTALGLEDHAMGKAAGVRRHGHGHRRSGGGSGHG